MDDDGVLSAIVLAISLLVFLLASLVQASIAGIGQDRLRALLNTGVRGAGTLVSIAGYPMGSAAGVTALRLVSVTLGAASLAGLIVARGGTGWAYVAAASVGFLIYVALVSTYATIFARIYGERVALTLAVVAKGLCWLFYPVLWAQMKLVSMTLRSRGLEPTEHASDISIGGGGEALDEHERRMIRGVVELDRTMAREIMAPRVDVVAAEESISLVDMADLMVDRGHSRVPVYGESIDHIKGVAYARDVLRHLSMGEDSSTSPVSSVIRPALFIPESKTLEELLTEFQERRMQIAIVVDEYGGVSGLVTIEDLLEEIVGEIQDEFDHGEPEIKRVGDNEYLIDARIGMDEIYELLSVRMEGDGFDTLGGFVYQQLGKIPSPGDIVEFSGLRIEVISTTGRRLKMLKVTRLSPPPKPARNGE